MGNPPEPPPPATARKEHRFPQIALCDLPTQTSGIVSHLKGDKEFRNRVACLGFTIGARLTVLHNRGRDPLIISVLGAHIALGRQEARLIHVQPL